MEEGPRLPDEKAEEDRNERGAAPGRSCTARTINAARASDAPMNTTTPGQ